MNLYFHTTRITEQRREKKSNKQEIVDRQTVDINDLQNLRRSLKEKSFFP